MKALSHSANTPERYSRGIRLLFRSMRPKYTELLLPEVHQTADGFEYDVYNPRGKAIRTVILIYGMTIGGQEDVRVMKFARSCANAGLKVIVPHLPGLREFLVSLDDMRRLESIANRLTRENDEKIGLIGFSTGGSYALLLAGRPALCEMIGPVVLFSPIYNVRDVAERLHAPIEPVPNAGRDLDRFIWAQFVIAYRNRQLLSLSPEVQGALQIFLGDYDTYDLEVKRLFHQNHVASLNLTGRSDLVNEGAALDLLSARGQLSAVKAPVFILHDASDRVVPPDHSRQIYAELNRRSSGFRQDVLITPWLSHVVMQTSGSPSELFKIIAFLSELFRSA